MKTTILTHADCDGMCAAAIALAKYNDAVVFFTKPVSLLPDFQNTKADRIIICDIALTKSHAAKIGGLFLKRSKNCEIIYFDHHQVPDTMPRVALSAIEHVHRLNVSTSELIYRHYQKDIPRERVWIALYGAIGDYEDDTPFAMERIANWDKRALYFEVSTLVMGIKNKQFASYDAKRNIVETMSLGKNPSDVPGLVRSAKLAVTREFELYDYIKRHAEKFGKIGVIKRLPQFGFRGPAALFAATVTDTVIGVYVCERDGHTDITVRKRNSKIALNKLMEEAAETVGGSGGGHSEAAGARIPQGTLDKFLHHVNQMVESHGGKAG
jgi:single-stranded-DNA-specific exonuclease